MRKNAMIGLLGVVVIILLAAFMMRGPSQPNSGAPALEPSTCCRAARKQLDTSGSNSSVEQRCLSQDRG
jgi:hypothetical protein